MVLYPGTHLPSTESAPADMYHQAVHPQVRVRLTLAIWPDVLDEQFRHANVFDGGRRGNQAAVRHEIRYAGLRIEG